MKRLKLADGFEDQDLTLKLGDRVDLKLKRSAALNPLENKTWHSSAVSPGVVFTFGQPRELMGYCSQDLFWQDTGKWDGD